MIKECAINCKDVIGYIVCPWCGDKQVCDGLCLFDYEKVCKSCGKKFEYECKTVLYCSTKKMEEE